MAKTKRRHRFLLVMAIYAVVLCAVGALAMWQVWRFLTAYEASRPANAVAEYMQTLTPEYAVQRGMETLSWDVELESREQVRKVILESLSEGFRSSKDGAGSTQELSHYVLYTGHQKIGEFFLAAGEKDGYGFSRWTVTEDGFDFSYLKSEPKSLTVPEGYAVQVGDRILGEEYRTEKELPVPALEEYYEAYSLPHLVTYTADDFFGELSLTVTDPQGNPVTPPEGGDWSPWFHSGEEEARLKDFVAEFFEKYVNFSASNKKNVRYNYAVLSRYLVPQGALQKRLYGAIDGLQFGQSVKDTISAVQTNFVCRLDDTHVLYDATYTLDSQGKNGTVQTTHSFRLTVQEEKGKTYIEAMSGY